MTSLATRPCPTAYAGCTPRKGACTQCSVSPLNTHDVHSHIDDVLLKAYAYRHMPICIGILDIIIIRH